MMKPTRRDFLAGTIGAGVVTILPSAPIASLASVTTLAALAAENKYASSVHHIPDDIYKVDFGFSLNGESLPKDTFIQEIYAPGDDTGWAVVYVKPFGAGKVELVTGNWKMWRV